MAKTQAEIQRPIANFSPSLWGDQFIKDDSGAKAAEKHCKAVEELKKEVMNMITAAESNLVEAMNHIDTLERLGISYHFEKEIDQKLNHFFNLNTDY
ncbi:(-)-5-epieremophilene synthase STPS3-like [Salvia miltiorrhiza]|uniref:(-)-5-epieremophilene synthase STPS3-like n=1 Tax=Salvia miltiorrhiza TaxID=226208 RepID=UPI0025AC144B|nr:(-)-5-epieremophilene synthase STPS3-like [Salvia miltiorrhiza]